MSSESSGVVPPCSTPTLDEVVEDGEIVPPQNISRGRVELATDTDHPENAGTSILEVQSVARPGDSNSHNVDEGKIIPRQYLETILRTRYGMKPCSQAVLESLPSYCGIHDDTTPTISEVRKYMVEKDAQLEDDDHAASIRYIFLHVKEGKPLPPALWDLQESNISLKKVAYSFRFVREARLTPPVYRIIPLNKRYLRSWTLVVPHATTVLQVVRNKWGPSLEDLIEEFVSLGIPFFTPALSSSPPHGLRRPETVFENFSRPFSFQPNAYTYTTYELQREEFLRHPHARAALLRGGILWRLCKSSFEGRLGLVNGPSSDVRVFGEARLFSPTTKDGAPTWAWDDVLTDDEVDLICGVYYVAAETGGRDRQWSTLSWWPRPSVFNKYGLWTGYWNASCEFWFQRRLNLIRCGEAKPFKASQWRSELKYSHKKTEKLCDLTEDASARFIGEVLG